MYLLIVYKNELMFEMYTFEPVEFAHSLLLSIYKIILPNAVDRLGLDLQNFTVFDLRRVIKSFWSDW